MNVGDIIRARSIRHYMDDKGWVEFAAKYLDGQTRKASEKMVFLFAFMGVEHLVCDETNPPLSAEKIWSRIGALAENKVLPRLKKALRRRTLKATRADLREIIEAIEKGEMS